MAESLFQLDDSLGGVRLHDNHRDAQLLGNFRGIKAETGFFRDIDHVQGEHAGLAEFDDLEDKLEVALKVRGINHADDEVGFCRAFEFSGEGIEGDLFIRGVRAQRVTAGEVENV